MARLPDRVAAFRCARMQTDLKVLDGGVRGLVPRPLGECLK